MKEKIVLLIFVSLFGCSSGKNYDAVSELKVLNELRDEFLAQAKAHARALDFVPEIRNWTRPSLASWREEQRAVAIPVWTELSASQISSLSALFGSEARAKEIFPLLFRWFLIPHELFHAVQTNFQSHLNHWKSEKFANDVAAAFLSHTHEGKMRLQRLEALLTPVIVNLPQIETAGLDEETYFEKEYHNLGKDPLLYGNFQLRFILRSLQNREKLELQKLFLNL
ncbi:MAG: hypothetical protein HYV97_05410 [Bdellovibrio sp.]|nr:hypothetical protein [Bdellovibrio sp.]